MLKELLKQLEQVQNDETLDYLEKMKLEFHIKDLIAEEELKELLDK